MRIALVSYEYPPETGFGGIGTYTRQAAQMLADRGHSVEVFAGALERSYSKHEENILLHRVYSSERKSFPNALLELFSRRHSQQPFDLVEGPEFMADSVVIRDNFPGIPHAVKLHTPSFLLKQLFIGQVDLTKKVRFLLGGFLRGKNPKPYWRYDASSDIEFKLTRSVPFILHPSRELGEIVSKKWNISSQQFIHLPYPFDPKDTFLRIPIKSDETQFKLISFIGRLEKRKGIFPLISAIPAICEKYPQVRFRFIGQAHPSPIPGLDMTEFMKKQLHLYKDRLEFTGSLSYDQIPLHLAETDICIFPSLWENFPNVCLEAMSAGRAVIGSKNGGMADMLGNDEHGLLVDPYKPESIVSAIEKLIENPELRIQLGQSAREKVLREYSYERIGALTEEIYSMIIDKWPQV